jgi:hypothetical protein
MSAKRIQPKNLIFSISNENIKDLTSKIDDLTKVDQKVILDMNEENTLFYSLAGGTNVNAFKSHVFESSDYFEGKISLEEPLKFIFTDAKKFHKVLSHFKDFDEEVKVKIVYNDDFFGERILLKNSKLKLEVAGALPHTLGQSVTLEQIQANMDVEKSNFSFKLNSKDFDKIKKLSQINKENEYYELIVRNNTVIIGESDWTLDVDEIESPNDKLSFPKKFFNTIKIAEDDIEVFCFNHFILVITEDTNLMITTELTV